MPRPITSISFLIMVNYQGTKRGNISKLSVDINVQSPKKQLIFDLHMVNDILFLFFFLYINHPFSDCSLNFFHITILIRPNPIINWHFFVQNKFLSPKGNSLTYLQEWV